MTPEEIMSAQESGKLYYAQQLAVNALRVLVQHHDAKTASDLTQLVINTVQNDPLNTMLAGGSSEKAQYFNDAGSELARIISEGAIADPLIPTVR